MKEDARDYTDDDQEFTERINRFKNSLISGKTEYFDVSEYEDIIEQLLEEGDLELAELAVVQGIKIHPNAIPLQVKDAQINLSKGNIKRALEKLKRVEKVESTNPDVYLLKGTAYTIEGDEKNAIEAFKLAIRHAKDELDDILYHIGAAFMHSGDVKLAVYYLEKSLRINPDNETVLYELGFLHDQLGNLKKSISYYNKFLDLDPFNSTAWYNLGIVYNKNEELEKAIDAYDYALALNDKFHQAIFNKANTLSNLGEFQEAIKHYEEYLEGDPNNDEAYCYIGECYLNLDKFRKALKSYQKAIRINQNNDNAWYGAGLIMMFEKQYEESVIFFKKAIKIDSQISDYWFSLGKIYTELDLIDKSITAYKKAVEVEPDNLEMWLTFIEEVYKTGDFVKTIKLLEEACKNIKNNSILKFRLAAYHFVEKKFKKALAYFEEGLILNSEDYKTVLEIYPELTKNKEANKLIQKYTL